jgi:tRNA-specific 2-thiouridylase
MIETETLARPNVLGIGKAPHRTRVVAAMSGGVDSSVVAALLAEQGFEVIGITLQLSAHAANPSRKGACCAGEDVRDARAVAERIGIPHYVLAYEKRFREQVMAPFAASYAAGETPVPCVVCNQTVKFRDLLRTARDLGADALATGHYVRRIAGARGPELHRAADPGRDQSYFLFASTRDQLEMLRFPLGDLCKDETRALAVRFGLPVADKPDSQDICFVPDGRYAGIVERLRPGAAEPGDIVARDGTVLGRHPGVIHFTVGQRRGLRLAGAEPLYVVRLEPEARRVVVAPRAALERTRFRLRDVNWLGDAPPSPKGERLQVRVRSTQAPRAATYFPGVNGGGEVVLESPDAGVAPGQACVFSAGARVLGGGWIRRD